VPTLGPSAVPAHASERRSAGSIRQCNASLLGNLGTAIPQFDKVTLCLVVASTVAQCLTLGTTKNIFDLIVLKLVTSEVLMRLVASIDHWDIGLDASLQQPR